MRLHLLQEPLHQLTPAGKEGAKMCPDCRIRGRRLGCIATTIIDNSMRSLMTHTTDAGAGFNIKG
jgi:hypothetical protein